MGLLSLMHDQASQAITSSPLAAFMPMCCAQVQLLHHMPTAAITNARRQGVARARLLRILVGRALLILRFFLTSSTVPDERRIVQADVEPNNEANRRLYENFICRTEGGAYGSSFEQCTPSIKRRGWLGYRFAAAPTRIRSLPCRPRLCGDQK